MKKTFLLSIMLVLMLTVSAVFADDLSDVKQAGVLRFGAPLEYMIRLRVVRNNLD